MTALAQPSIKLYSVRRPLAAALAGVAVALLGGLIGLGGAEFRLPILIMLFAVFAHRAVRINLLIRLATLATAAVVRLRYIPDTSVGAHFPEVASMAAAGIVAAWLGAGRLARISRDRIKPVIAALLSVVAVLLIVEAAHLLDGVPTLPADPTVRVIAGLTAGLLVGAISSLLGVAGGEFIIPILIFAFGADIKTAGTASVLISIPIVATGVARHWLNGHFRSKSMLTYLVLPMALGSVIGASLGSMLTAYAPTEALRIALATLLALSSWKLWREPAR
jgi:uncharacterized membrane protein YfcA